jgi:hypothetical protein
MRLLPIFIFLTTIAFSQNSNVHLTETERLVQAIIESNVDLKTGEYVVYNKLVDTDTLHLGDVIIRYGLVDKVSPENLTLNHSCLQLINDKELSHFKMLADSLNKDITDPLERKNGSQLIKEHLQKEYCEFSKPLYSKDGKYVLISFKVDSGFMIGSFSRTYLMKKINGKWIKDALLQVKED